MDKRKFLKVILSSTAGMLSVHAYPNTAKHVVSSQKLYLKESVRKQHANSSILSKKELSSYLNEVNNRNESLIHEANSLVFGPKSARDILVHKDKYSASFHSKACAYYNSKLFYRLITTIQNTESGAFLSDKLLGCNFADINKLKQSLLTDAMQIDEDFMWLTLDKHTLQLNTSGGEITCSPFPLHGNSDSHLPVISIDMRHEVYSQSYRNKLEYIEQVVSGLNWELFNKRILRFIS